MTTQPLAAIFGDHSLDTAPPADIRQKSMPEKSKVARSLHLSVASPNDTSTPTDRREASACTSRTGNWRSLKIDSISRPTLPVAPTTAIRIAHGALVPSVGVRHMIRARVLLTAAAPRVYRCHRPARMREAGQSEDVRPWSRIAAANSG